MTDYLKTARTDYLQTARRMIGKCNIHAAEVAEAIDQHDHRKTLKAIEELQHASVRATAAYLRHIDGLRSGSGE